MDCQTWPPYFAFWGKARRKGPGRAYHLLPFHALDVAAVGKVLLERHPTLCAMFARLLGLQEAVFARWVIFFLALHDLGKFSDWFQNLRPELLTALQGRELEARASTERHDHLGYACWLHHLHEHLANILDVEAEGFSAFSRPELGPGFEFMAQAVLGHHGVPPKGVSNFNDAFGVQGKSAITAFTDDLIELLFDGDIRELPRPDATATQKGSWLLAGFAVLCDWLGSNRDYFEYRDRPMALDAYWIEAQECARKVVDAAELLPAEAARGLDYQALFKPDSESQKTFVPTPLQARCRELTLAEGPQLFLLEDVTGAGKTEAALMLVHRLMGEGNGAGTYFALPTMATANAMFGRMGEVYRRLFTGPRLPSLVLAHAARTVYKGFRDVIALTPGPMEDNYGDGTLPAGPHCGAWLADHPKKALLADVGVGTVDQALLAILTSRHQSLRLLGLSNKILIVDEVHACDAYMHGLLLTLLQAHAYAGGSAILLSATLPCKQRQDLVSAFARGCDTTAQTLEKTKNSDYPLLTHWHASGCEEIKVPTRESVRREVRVHMTASMQEVYAVIEDAVARGACVCWIRNTVGDALDAYDTLRKTIPQEHIDLFHARFAMGDRQGIERRVLDRFGDTSGPADRTGRVLIATQVISQSLDIDLDVMITDLAPIDLIIQRAGRLCRHSRNSMGERIEGEDERGTPALWIHGPEPVEEAGHNWFRAHFESAGAVYPDHGRLWLTARLFYESGCFCMPEDARAMIEEVYGETAQAKMPNGLLERSNKAWGEARSAASMAGLNTIRLSRGYSREDANAWPDEVFAPTRLGEATVTVYLARWDGEILSPWSGETENPWLLSAVRMREKLISSEIEHDDIPAATIQACKRELPAEGRWGVLLPLCRNAKGEWRGAALDKEDKRLAWRYSPLLGLMSDEV